MTAEREEQLRLKRGAGAARVEVAEKGILRLVEHDRRVEPSSEPIRQRRFADAERALDREIPKVQAA